MYTIEMIITGAFTTAFTIREFSYKRETTTETKQQILLSCLFMQ